MFKASAASVRKVINFKRLGVLLLLSTAVAFSALSLMAFPTPFLWVGLAWSGALTIVMLHLRRAIPRAILFNLAFLAAALTAVESYFSILVPHPAASMAANGSSDTLPVDWIQEDDVSGWAPKPGIQARATKFAHGRLLYNVTYSIASNGLRLTPEPLRTGSDCILFFGCSFTFGDGIEDEQTLPYLVGINSSRRYQAVNFAFNGFGAHQMLSQIEHGVSNKGLDCTPRYAIYTAIPHHVARVAGKVEFGHHAPRYELGPDGSVRKVGSFNRRGEPRSYLVTKLLNQLSKSAIYNLVKRKLSQQRVSPDDITLLLGLVSRSKTLLQAQYGGIEFHVILWEGFDDEMDIYRALDSGFRAMDIPIHLVNDILPGIQTDRSQYVLSQYDAHPSAHANSVLADYVLSRIVSPESRLD